MRQIFFYTGIIFLIISCSEPFHKNQVKVSSTSELNDALKNCKAGDEIVLSNGEWNDVQIRFIGKGTEEKPIILRAETPGEVIIQGKSNIKFGGEYLVVDGLHFKNGYSPSDVVIDFKINNDTVANHSRVTNCVIEDFNQPKRDITDRWVQFHGRYNGIDHCYIAGKTNRGPTVRVDIEGNESIKNYHKIVNNHFGPRPRKGGASGETIQLGNSFTSMSPSYTLVANNLFEACNGEVEIISSKTNFNEIRNNVFYKSEGSLVMRHGNYGIIDGNYFIGDDDNNNIGGIRIINTGHSITNNYFYNLRGENFRSPIAIMNGIPKSPLNRYNQVTDVVIAFNSWINCKSPWQFGVGTNVSQKDVLPLSEIRSARSERTLVANNLIYNEVGDKMPIVAHDSIDGVLFKDNIINNQGVVFAPIDGLSTNSFGIKPIADNIYVPIEDLSSLEVYQGFEFETFSKDLFGNSREAKNSVGAIVNNASEDPMILDKKKYGTNWFSNEIVPSEAEIFQASSSPGDLEAKLSEAKNGDIIQLQPGTYQLTKSLVVDKKITIQSKENEKAIILYSGAENTPAFELHPYGNLTLNNVKLSGTGTQQAFASLKDNMFNHFGLTVSGVEIDNFNYVLKAYKETFAEAITFSESTFKNCLNGIELSEETNDKGDYNVEFLTINNCQFDNVKKNVIDYYRGGYDESTIGGNLMVTNSSFTNCGALEENGILVNTRGIVNVDISKNFFQNNPVKLVALLWGAKNNTHSDNQIKNSGEIRVEENLKMKLMY